MLASSLTCSKQNVDWWGILLEMIWQVDEQLSQSPYNLRIPDDLRDSAVEWLARVVTKKTERAEMEAVPDHGIRGQQPDCHSLPKSRLRSKHW